MEITPNVTPAGMTAIEPLLSIPHLMSMDLLTMTEIPESQMPTEPFTTLDLIGGVYPAREQTTECRSPLKIATETRSESRALTVAAASLRRTQSVELLSKFQTTVLTK